MGISLALRSAFAIMTGAICTVSLFYIMQSLIEHGEQVVKQAHAAPIVDMVRVKEERQLQVKQRRVEKPQEPDELPPAPKQDFEMAQTSVGYQISTVALDNKLEIGAARYGVSDSEYLPIVKVMPAYPQRAAVKNLVGWVMVEFTVTSQGTVRDPVVIDNCAIISMKDGEVPCEASPSSVFDKSALEAALKFKYVPKTIDGVAIDTAGVRNLFTFHFMDG
jgi:protein TonB